MAYPITIFFATAAALSTPAMASEGPLKIASKIFVEQRALDRDGAVRATLVPATRAVPGDHVVFVLAYRNTGTQSLSDLVLDNPVPGAIRYSAVGAQSAAPEVSVDGKAYGPLGQLRIPVVGGGMRTATAADVKHVRWRLAMVPAGGQGQFAFNAILK